MPASLSRYDIVLDAEELWWVLAGTEPAVEAVLGESHARVALEQPIELVDDPLPFLRIQRPSPLVRALIAWRACKDAGRDAAKRVASELARVVAIG